VMHSEVNQSNKPVRLLQIWILPEAEGLKPSYEDRTFPAEEKRNQLRLIASHDGRGGSAPPHHDTNANASLLEDGQKLELELQRGRHAWVQLVRGELDVNGTRLSKGDGAAIRGETKLQLTSAGSNGEAEFLLFDLA